MILFTLCNSCLQPFQVTIRPEDKALVESLPDKDGLAPCPRQCGGKISFDHEIQDFAKDKRLRKPLHVTGKELYQAVHGMGLPDEVTDDPDIIEALFKANRIASVKMEQAMGRLFMHEILLDNGMVVHLSAGAKGAQVLKVTRPA